MIDPATLWDFDDPPGSEARFRAAARVADGADRSVLLTQVARALALQEKFDDGHAVLDEVAAAGSDSPEVGVRLDLERGRLLRSAGGPDAARPRFEAAVEGARAAGLDVLLVDALHMVALVAPPAAQVAIVDEALAVARASSDPRARDWDASLLNNRGMTAADAGDFAAALADFEAALAARRRIGVTADVRVARWMVAWAWRHLGRADEALAEQRALQAEFAADGAHDPYVDEEIALLEAAPPGA